MFEGTSCIKRPTINANNFVLKTGVIQLVQNQCLFGGLPNDDPNKHITSFLDICDTKKQNGVPTYTVRLLIFPFSLRDRAKLWFNSLPMESIETWEEMIAKFLAKYFSPSKAVKLKSDITTFYQFENESIYEAWEGIKDC